MTSRGSEKVMLWRRFWKNGKKGPWKATPHPTVDGVDFEVHAFVPVEFAQMNVPEQPRGEGFQVPKHETEQPREEARCPNCGAFGLGPYPDPASLLSEIADTLDARANQVEVSAGAINSVARQYAHARASALREAAQLVRDPSTLVRCPTCGSDDPVRTGGGYRLTQGGPCPDPFHSTPEEGKE